MIPPRLVTRTGAVRAEMRRAVPRGARLPSVFQDYLERDLPDLDPVFWLPTLRRASLQWRSILRELYPTRSLIPFAKNAASDDVFCFDPSRSDMVFRVHAYASPGWEDRGAWPTFAHWLSSAMTYHDEWLAGRAGMLDAPGWRSW